MNRKVNVARLSVLSNSLLIVMKVIVGILSGSISILSEAIHSFMDLLAAIIAFFSVRISDTPADERHPYGHGKFENISGVIEAILIFFASGWIIFEAVKKIIHLHPVEKIGLGIVVMVVSAAVQSSKINRFHCPGSGCTSPEGGCIYFTGSCRRVIPDDEPGLFHPKPAGSLS
jgi:cation diffusion facilitator family transporter